MHLRRKPWTGESAFTQLEVLLSIMLFSSAIVFSVELFVALTARITTLARVERNSLGPKHVLSSFSAALHRATHCAIYADRFSFEHLPYLAAASGDFAVIWQKDGPVLAFELAHGELRILENPGSDLTRERLWATGVEAPRRLFTLENGALVLNFTATIGSSPTSFTTCARAAFAQ